MKSLTKKILISPQRTEEKNLNKDLQYTYASHEEVVNIVESVMRDYKNSLKRLKDS